MCVHSLNVLHPFQHKCQDDVNEFFTKMMNLIEYRIPANVSILSLIKGFFVRF